MINNYSGKKKEKEKTTIQFWQHNRKMHHKVNIFNTKGVDESHNNSKCHNSEVQNKMASKNFDV